MITSNPISFPKISVCIATYNGEKYILEQLISILKQLSLDDEIIISDDGSSDRTIEIVKSLSDNRIKLFYNQTERGYTNNFQNALKNSSGEIIFLSDQDDVWLEGKVETCLSILKNYDFVVTDAIVVDSYKNILEDSFYKLKKPYKSLLGNFFRFSYLGCCMCFKKEVLSKAYPFPNNQKLCTHDNWLFLVGKAFYKMKILNKPFILYRRHGNNVSPGGEKYHKVNSLFFMIKYRFYLIFNLLHRKYEN